MATLAADVGRRAPSDHESQGLVLTYQRLMLVMLLFAGAIVLISARLAQLQITSGDGGRVSAAVTLPPRGEIVDRNGVVLATTIDAWVIGVQPANILGDKADLAAKLNELMPEQSAEWYLRQLNSTARFTYFFCGCDQMWIAVELNQQKNGSGLFPLRSSQLRVWPRTSESNVSIRFLVS